MTSRITNSIAKASLMQSNASSWSVSSNLSHPNLEDLPLDSNFAWLLFALAIAMIWIVYLTYYNSRIIGFLLTKLMNKFIKEGYVKIGSFSVSVLSGKVMFRDIAYINKDYSLRVQDGWMKFRWWLRYVKRSISEDLSQSDTRISLLLNGFELHVYNRSEMYDRLERVLGLDPKLVLSGNNEHDDSKEGRDMNSDIALEETHKDYSQWRDLIPVVKIDVSSGRLVFGNRLLPTTLLISIEEAHLVYTTRPAYHKVDLFMHSMKCKAENFKVILANSPKYTGMDDEPPRFMGEGFVVLQSNGVELYYYMDQPGIVPKEPEIVELADGESVRKTTAPVWGLDIKCGKGTDFSYGPWADRQREHLFKFFFPQDYQPLHITKIAQPGERRQYQSFDIRLSTLADATVDTLFSKNKETMAVHMNVKPGSYLEMTIPWIITNNGYTTKINGQLFHLDASTSLQYRSLMESETLEFDVRVKYPLIWNDTQQWTCNITGCKASVNLIYSHKGFFQDLITDWSSKAKPDLLHFVPYTFHFNLILKEFEVILISNERNWIDCSSQHQENNHLAFCGELFDLSVDLPFIEFLPPTLPVKIWIQGECVDLAMFLPETNTYRNIVTALDLNCKLTKRDGSVSRKVDNEKKWRNKAQKSDGWIDCWTVPIVALSISYMHHPVPTIVTTDTDLNITTPEKEELLLNPIRPPTGDGEMCVPQKYVRPDSFDPTTLPPDVVSVELEVGPSVLFLYGALLTNFKHVKENYFGADQVFHDFDSSSKNSPTAKPNAVFQDLSVEDDVFDPRLYRPLEVTVSITMHDIQGHFVKNCRDDGPPCPSIYLERFGFEMYKSYHETKLQLLLSPVVLSATDVVQRPESHQHLKDGHLALSGLQVRGHAMFSDDGLTVNEETLEYAWLVEIQFGHFTGRLTAPHLHHIMTSLETFLLLLEDAENALQLPSPYKSCHHGLSQLHCPDTKPDLFCPTSDDIKYRMTRLSVGSLNLFLVESGTALNLQVNAIKIATCNLHCYQTESGITAVVQHVHLRQYMMTGNSASNAALGSAPSNMPPVDVWLEVGSLKFGPVYLDSIRAQSHIDMHILQDAYLRKHDERTKRLWFLWPPNQCCIPQALIGKCGCRGACNFFGSNHYRYDVLAENSGVNEDPQQTNQSKNSFSGPGYGQSLLHKGQMIFDVLIPSETASLLVSPNLENNRFSFTRGYMNQCPSASSRDISEHSLSSILHSNSSVTGGTRVQNSISDVTLPANVNRMESTVSDSPCSTAAVRLSSTSGSPTPINTSVGAPLPPPQLPPPVQRAFSQPESREMSSDVEQIPASPMHIPISSSSTSMVTFSVDKMPIQDMNTSSQSQPQGRTASVKSLQSSAATRHPSAESPVKDNRLVLVASSHQSLHSLRSGQDIKSSSVPNGNRTSSVGGESSLSLDVFYPAVDEMEKKLSDPHNLHSESGQEANISGSNQSFLQTVIEVATVNASEDKDSNSASSTSFISALSSQEDLALVDLHMQLNKPIIESPLLMFAYNSHMTRLMCSHWYELPPLPHNTPQSTEVPKHHPYWGSQWIPHFYSLAEGFTSIKIVDEEQQEQSTYEGSQLPPKHLKPPSLSCPWDFPQKLYEEFKQDEEMDEDIFSCDSTVSKSTMVVKLNGDINVCISPLLLEASQQFIEAVTPTVSSLHPLTIINHLHAHCVSSVQASNQLKKDKYMYVSHLREVRRSTDSNGQSRQTSPYVYEETHTSKLHAFISVKKINVSVLQASISEEMTSFSALDNIRDITCVSLLIMSMSNLSGKVFTSTQSRKSIQTLQIAKAVTMQRRKGKDSRLKKSKPDWDPPDPVAIETNETQQEEMIGTFDFQKVHLQLRRLKNSSSILKEAVLTVIPKHRSKVFFTYEKPNCSLVQPMPLSNSDNQTDAFVIHDPATELEDIMGFIMFECGLEGFCVKLMKRIGFETASSKEQSPQNDLSTATFPRKDTPVTKAPAFSSLAQSAPIPHTLSEELDSELPTPCDGRGRYADNTSLQDSVKQGQLKDVFSCVVDLKTVWFNFAAPPHMPNTRKIDYTRLDWHLLSTATPAINSWLNPSNRLLVAVQKLIEGTHFRHVAVIASLMAEALQEPGLHLPVQGKCNKLTPLARTLREDPSCQLLTVLQRYMNISSLPVLEEILSSDMTPKLDAIHKGLVALARQWKNVLYMPSVVERNIKSMQANPKAFSVSFAVPVMESLHTRNTDFDPTTKECEVTDDKILLLNAEGGSISAEDSVEKQNGLSSSDDAVSSSVTGSHPELTEGEFSGSAISKLPKKRLHCHQPRSSRASVALPVGVTGSLDSYGHHSEAAGPSFSTRQRLVNKQVYIDERMHRNASTISLHSGCMSVSSLDAGGVGGGGLWNMSKQRFPPGGTAQADSENLYNWMARQQDYHRPAHNIGDPVYEPLLNKQDSKGDTLGSDDTKTSESQLDIPQSSAFSLAPLAAQLADAQILFNPLLTGLGVPSQITESSLGQRFGPNLTVKATLLLFKIDIVESETTNKGIKRRKVQQTRFFINTSMESSAFQCEKLSVEVDLREVQDLERAKTEVASSAPAGQQTLIYATVSGFQKHNTVAVNFCINVHDVCQQVNLPLLRLLHQCSSVYQNARDTQMELNERRPEFKSDKFRSHKKKSSSSGSESHTDIGKMANSSLTGSPIAGEPSPVSSILVKELATPSGGSAVSHRPHGFTQRLRASKRGYTSLLERKESQLSINLSYTNVEMGGASCASDDTLVNRMKERTPRCWRTMYYLLDLYATMPETKTIANRSPIVPPDNSENYKGNGKYEPLKEHRIDMEETVHLRSRTFSSEKLRSLRKSLVVKERVPLVVFGVLKVRCCRLLATLSGLKLEAELTSLQASHTHKEKVQGSSKKWTETSATGYLGRAMIVLLEGVLPNQQTVVKVTVGKSQALYSGHSKHAKEKNSALLTIGPISVEIPQHPVALHGMMTRSTKQLSTTLQELRAPRGPLRHSRPSDEGDVGSSRSPRPSLDMTLSTKPEHLSVHNQKLLQPIVHFSIILDSLAIGASLLPSLTAKYQMGQVTSIGVTGNKAKFTVDLPKHSLSFETKINELVSEANLPSSASVDLPPLHLSAEYVQQSSHPHTETINLHFVDGAVLRKGSYLNAVADLGAFEHSLTTDLLNHLVFVQKVFMKEINEVVQKMSGGDKPVRLWTGEGKGSASSSPQLLYSVQLRLKGIQITAMTPTNSAVRLETGVLELQLSNRVQNLCGSAGQNNNAVAKLFGKAQVELHLSLGQLLKDAMFEEADPEFQQVAYFKTRIALRNALQDEMVSNAADDKEAVLITLHRPLIYIQPAALDKAVLVWLNYKNAYEYWNEQRSSLNKEVLTATQQVLEKVPPMPQLGSHGFSALFLQLTVDDMGICLPLSPYTSVFNISRQVYDSELRAACVVTLESTRISACSSGSLVSKGRFQGLCIRFADDFETSLDDWKPDPNDPNIMNLCVVSEGTYEVCSRTVVHQGPENAKWILNVQWEMEGVAIHVDTNIGKQLSALAHTLTSLAFSQVTGEESDDQPDGISRIVQAPVCRKGSVFVEGLPDFVFDPNMDAKKRSRLIEQEMNEQVKIVNDLRILGASHSTIEQETRRLADLENLIFSDFKRDVMKKLRRQSMKQASSFKEKLGLSSKHTKPTTLATPAPSPEKFIAHNIGLPPELSKASSSQTSSPNHGHARTASLDSARVTFNYDVNGRYHGIDLSLGEKWPSADTMDCNPLYGPIPSLASSSTSHRHPSVISTPTNTSESSPFTTTTPSELLSDVEQGIDVLSSPSPSEAVNDNTHFEVPHTNLQSGLTGIAGVTPGKQAVAEPNIDFELDVKVFINSGKCVLHTKDFREEELRSQKSMGRERSFSSGTFDFPMSPGHRKKTTNLRTNASLTKIKFVPTPQTQVPDFTVFLIPGLDVKVHYNSRTECPDNSIPHSTSKSVHLEEFVLQEQIAGLTSSLYRPSMKRASLFAWMTLQSIPEETVITPHILDFLEKALEPIPLPLPQAKGHMTQDAVEHEFDNTTLTSSLVAPSAYAYASFPVDVIVYLRIQPSTLRFSCLPVSRVECLLRLPSLDLVISTKRAEEELSGEFGETTVTPKSRYSGLTEVYLPQAAVGGLSITACLADFSVYIFHPYGGKKAGTSGSNKDLTGEASPLASNSDRKDALSIQLEFVKVNISRSRKINLALDQTTGLQLKQGHSADHYGGAVIRFSSICDIGSASFKYDMRRLTEILAFPKAWYRRTIVRRLFLGEQSTAVFGSDQEDSGSSADSSLSPVSISGKGEKFTFSNLSLSDVYTSSTEPLLATHDAQITATSRGPANRHKLTLELPNVKQRRRGTVSAPPSPMNEPKAPTSVSKDVKESSDGRKASSSLSTPPYNMKSGSTWETLVLFAVNLSKLNIHMNMGNVMGNTVWTTRGLQSEGRLSIGSSGHKNMSITVGLGGSSLDAKGGIVGGTIELSQVNTYLHIKEDPGQEPDHRIGVKLFALESRLDYMGTSVLMGRVSSLDVTLRDEWRVNTCQLLSDKDLPTKRPAFIFIHGDLAWDQLQLMISKSTTPDLLKMHSKLEEFFAQQFHSSKRVFSSLQPSSQEATIHSKRPNMSNRKSTTNKTPLRNQARTPVTAKKLRNRGLSGDDQEPRHHRHWQAILAKASGLTLPTLVTPLPKHGTILGGTMELYGNNISLACFHGVNFRSKSWALFSLKEPTISFATEAQDVVNAEMGSVDTHIIQNLSFTLGHNLTEHTRHKRWPMATVCRISRNIVFPPQFRSMQEWFHYAFSPSKLDEVDRFPGLERERRDSFTQERQPRHSPKGQDCNHSTENIFALPSLQLHLKTEHFQTQKTPGARDFKPVVECSFISEFEDHISVAVDAEAFFFLHDLITAYIKEKDRVGTPAGHSSKFDKSSETPSQTVDRKVKVADPTEALQKDWRDYECKTWHLEPTVRLLSWAGKQIEPYGIDYILQKLGFSHARVTIPKWMQRGAMDPLDKLLSVLMQKMVNALRDGGSGKNEEAKP